MKRQTGRPIEGFEPSAVPRDTRTLTGGCVKIKPQTSRLPG
jgi:hypothetical protein